MLKPTTDRLDYGELLAPPEGYTLNTAVGTSYSLDLDALLGACMALGLSAETDSKLLNNPVYLLETLRRTGDRVILFCQAGQIQIPSNSSPLYILLEKIVFQMQVKKQKSPPLSPSFHPKFWLLKYVDPHGNALYRTIILSRNLTFDRSWDVSVSLDGYRQKSIVPKSRPVADFVDYLAASINGGSANDKAKRALLRKLASEIEYVDFQPDSRDFTEFEFIPVGVPRRDGGVYGMNETQLFSSAFHELLIMSPFLSGGVIQEFNTRNKNIANPKCVLITRRESLEHLQSKQCDKFSIYTMKDAVVDGETAISDGEENAGKQDIHAKLYMWRRYAESELYLGSLNASHSALHGNIEFVLRLISKNRWLNIEKLTNELFGGLPGNKDNPFELTSLPELPEQKKDPLSALEKQIKDLCRLSPKASVETQGDKYRIVLQFDKLENVANITISPLLCDKPVPLTPTVVIDGLSLLQLSEFYCVSANGDGAHVRRVIKIPTENIPQNRESAVVSDVIKDSGSFFQYIAFLLGDDYLTSVLEGGMQGTRGWSGASKGISMPALYERMLRTAADSPEKFGEIEYIMKMVDGEGVVPEGFTELYQAFRKAVGIRG